MNLLASPYAPGEERLALLSRDELSFLKLCDGKRTLGEIKGRLESPSADVGAFFEKWSRPCHGVLDDESMVEEDSDSASPAEGAPSEPTSDTFAYHAGNTSDALHQFETMEMTVSHVYREPHPALGGRTYGQALADTLMARGDVKGRVLEIGGGTGILARNLLKRLRDRSPEVYRSLSYTIMDLSPNLLAAQRTELAEHMERVDFIHGNVEHGLPGGSFDLILANEVIADLSVVELGHGSERAEAVEALKLIDEHGVDVGDGPARFHFNLGAAKLIGAIRGALAAGGAAYLVEYADGSPDSYPAEIVLDGHSEYSIHFGHLARVAEGLGLEHRQESLAEFLDFDSAVEVIRLYSFFYLKRHVLHFLGRDIPSLAYTRERLDAGIGDLGWFGNLDFRPVGHGKSLMDPGGFWVLEMRLNRA